MYKIILLLSLLTQQQENYIEPLFINLASEEEIREYPILLNIEADNIIRERKRRLFKDEEDFRKRVPLSLLTQKLLIPLLDFTSREKHILRVKLYTGFYYRGRNLKEKFSLYAGTGKTRWHFQIKDSILESRTEFKGEKFKLKIGNFMPGSIAYLEGKGGYSGPFRGEMHSTSVRSIHAAGKSGENNIEAGLGSYSEGIYKFFGMGFSAKQVKFHLMALKTHTLKVLLSEELNKPLSIEVAYSPLDFHSLHLRLQKRNTKSRVSVTGGRENSEYILKSYWRVSGKDIRTSSTTYFRKNKFYFSQRLQWIGVSVPGEIRIYIKHKEETQQSGLRLKILLPGENVFIGIFAGIGFHGEKEKRLNFSTGLTFIWGPLLFEEIVTSGSGTSIYPPVYIPGARQRENSYIQGVYFRDVERGIFISMVRTVNYEETFWSIYSGFRMNFKVFTGTIGYE